MKGSKSDCDINYAYAMNSPTIRRPAFEWGTIATGVILFGFLSYWFTRPYVLLFVLGLIPTGVSAVITLKKTTSLRKATLAAVATLVILDIIWLMVVSILIDQVAL